jgi:hypothetical protein
MSPAPLKLAVLGDSRATNFGCDQGSDAFPELLAGLIGDGYEVRNFARPALRLDEYLKDLSELLAWQPDVVVSAFGGRESMYRMSGWRKHLPCDADASLKGKGWRLPVAWLRRQAWRAVLGLFARSPAAFEGLMRLLGFHPYRTGEQYRSALDSLLSQLASTPAKTILMESFPSSMGKLPWCPSARAKNANTARGVAGQYPHQVRLWDPKVPVDFSGLFLGDGIHLNSKGHLAIAQALAAEITPYSQRPLT